MKPNPARRMPKVLKWGLAVTLLATVVSLLWPQHALVVAEVRHVSLPSSTRAPSRDTAVALPAIPAREGPLARLQPLADAGSAPASAPFDPFVGIVPPPAPAPAPVASPIVVAPTPAPPAQDFRFLGKVTGPDGAEQLLLTRGDTAVPVKVGTMLDNGYVVESVSAGRLVLVYPPLGNTASLPIERTDEALVGR